MQENKREGEHQDSYTIGTAGKEGAIKVYFDLKNTDDKELMKLIRKAKGLWEYSKNPAFPLEKEGGE